VTPPGTVRLVVQRLKHYATPGPVKASTTYLKHRDSWGKVEAVPDHGMKACGGGVEV